MLLLISMPCRGIELVGNPDSVLVLFDENSWLGFFLPRLLHSCVLLDALFCFLLTHYARVTWIVESIANGSRIVLVMDWFDVLGVAMLWFLQRRVEHLRVNCNLLPHFPHLLVVLRLLRSVRSLHFGYWGVEERVFVEFSGQTLQLVLAHVLLIQLARRQSLVLVSRLFPFRVRLHCIQLSFHHF